MSIHNRPVWQREFSYAESAYFSGTGADFSAVGLSGLANDLSGTPGYYYVVWGWQSLYVEDTAAQIHHLALELEDEDGKRRGIMHCSNNDNTAVMLPQPIRIKTGSGVYWEVLDTSMGGDDITHHEIYYSVVKEN